MLETLTSRGLAPALAICLVDLMLTLLVRGRSYLLPLVTGTEPRVVFLIEVIGVLATCVTVAVTGPQLWSWERIGPRIRVRVGAAIVAVLALVIPVAISFIGARSCGLDILAAHAVSSNVCAVGAGTSILALSLSRRAGPALGLFGYLLMLILANLTGSSAIPVNSTTPRPIVDYAAGLGLLCVLTCTFVTLGKSRWTARRERSD